MSSPAVTDVGFEISDATAEIIRARGGEIWIWSGGDRRPFATTWPAVSPEGEWTKYATKGLVVNVDSAIVPPERWVVATAVEGRRLVACWEGHNPDLFGRLPLETPLEERSEPLQSSPTSHVKAFLLVPALAWVLAAFWALRYVGVKSGWVPTAQAGVAALLAAIAVASRWWEKFAGWHAGRAPEADLDRSRV
jgi:hypothetical protein